MKYIIVLLLLIGKAYAQTDTINYIVVYGDAKVIPTGLTQQAPTFKIAGFKTQGTLNAFLNESIDSTLSVSIFDVRTKKPMKATFASQEKVVQIVERRRERNWKIQ